MKIWFWIIAGISISLIKGVTSTSDVDPDQRIIMKAKKDAEKLRTIFKEKLHENSTTNVRKKRTLDLIYKEKELSLCKVCISEVKLIKYYIANGEKTPEIINKLYVLCMASKHRPREYCKDVTNLIGPEIVEILNKSKNTPREVCSFVFNVACGNGDVPHHRWSIKLPPIPKPPMRPRVPPKLDTPKSKVLHISDTHIDYSYQEGARAICEFPMCCRMSNGMAKTYETAAGKWGSWKCDIPERTLDNMLQHIVHTHGRFDYIIWTGDIPPHATWSQTVNESKALLNLTVAKMLNYFPHTPIFPALGNHESSPPHNFPPPALGKQETISWLYEALADEWSNFLPKSTYDTVKYGGYYSATVRPGLKIVSLNTNFCYFNNWWLILNSTDPADMLAWFVKELQNAEDKNEKIHVIAHIPPGYADCLKIWSRNYYDIISRYEATVTAQFFGHTHTDEIEIFYNTKNKPASIGYVGPSASTFTFLNPGYRIYSIDGNHCESEYYVENFETWVMNLTHANLHDNPVYYKMFSAKEAYNLSSLLPEEWHKFYEKLKTDEALFDLYYRHYWKDSPERPPCGRTCRKKRLCDIRSCVHYGEPKLHN